MKRETGKIWKEGKQKKNQKAKWLLTKKNKKYSFNQKNKENENREMKTIKYKDGELDTIYKRKK